MGTVPLQNVEMAIAEMRRCVTELDLRGIEIASNVNGKDYHAAEFAPFFKAAEELGTLLFIHPLGFTQPGSDGGVLFQQSDRQSVGIHSAQWGT